MFAINVSRRNSERLLLKQCSDGVVEEQERFAQLSYSREIEFAIRRVLDGHPRGLRFQLPEDEVVALVTSCIFRVYAEWHGLPSIWCDLRVSVRRFAKAHAESYLMRKVAKPLLRRADHG